MDGWHMKRIHVYYPTTDGTPGPFHRYVCAACGSERIASQWEIRSTHPRVALCSSGRRIGPIRWILGLLRRRIDCLGTRTRGGA